MNTKTILAVAAAFIGSAAADTCSTSDQTTAYSTLASVLTLSSFQGCADESGFSLLYSTSLPDDAQYAKMCASDNCRSLIESVAALNPPDCDLTVPTSGLVLNVNSLTSGFSSKCSSLSSTSTTSSTAPSGASTPATDAPAATTAAPTTEASTTTTTTEAPTATSAATTATSNSTESTTQTATAC